MIKDKAAWILKSKIGAIRHNQLYGNPGTLEGRRKGGKKSALRFLDLDYAKKVGFVTRKEINYPPHSKDLAELIGIFLGDGGFRGQHQITFSYNRETDKDFADYLGNLLKKLFSLDYTMRPRLENLGADIVVTSTNLVDFLVKNGLLKGNKVKNQIFVPSWIKDNLSYSTACLRGLIDTDGGVYHHRYRSNGKAYHYLKLCFTNHSRPLLEFVHSILKKRGLNAYQNGNHVSVYSQNDVKKYFKVIGTHNLKHLIRFYGFFKIWRDAGVADRNRLLSD